MYVSPQNDRTMVVNLKVHCSDMIRMQTVAQMHPYLCNIYIDAY